MSTHDSTSLSPYSNTLFSNLRDDEAIATEALIGLMASSPIVPFSHTPTKINSMVNHGTASEDIPSSPCIRTLQRERERSIVQGLGQPQHQQTGSGLGIRVAQRTPVISRVGVAGYGDLDVNSSAVKDVNALLEELDIDWQGRGQSQSGGGVSGEGRNGGTDPMMTNDANEKIANNALLLPANGDSSLHQLSSDVDK
ncbi:hypothetical protein HDU76_011893, partial [Blyttiomyces sp. JEL0837]